MHNIKKALERARREGDSAKTATSSLAHPANESPDDGEWLESRVYPHAVEAEPLSVSSPARSGGMGEAEAEALHNPLSSTEFAAATPAADFSDQAELEDVQAGRVSAALGSAKYLDQETGAMPTPASSEANRDAAEAEDLWRHQPTAVEAKSQSAELEQDERQSFFAGIGRFVLGGAAVGVLLAGAVLAIRYLGDPAAPTVPSLSAPKEAQVVPDAVVDDRAAELSAAMVPAESGTEMGLPEAEPAVEVTQALGETTEAAVLPAGPQPAEGSAVTASSDLSPLQSEDVAERADQQAGSPGETDSGVAPAAANTTVEIESSSDTSLAAEVGSIEQGQSAPDVAEQALAQLDELVAPGFASRSGAISASAASPAVAAPETGAAPVVAADLSAEPSPASVQPDTSEPTQAPIDDLRQAPVEAGDQAHSVAADAAEPVEPAVTDQLVEAGAGAGPERSAELPPVLPAPREVVAVPPKQVQDGLPRPRTGSADEPSLAVYTRQNAERQLLALWNLDYQPRGAAFCSEVRGLDLECLSAGGGLPALLRFNRPAILKIDVTGLPAYALASKLSSDRVTLDVLGRQHNVRSESLEQVWDGDFVLVWRRPAEVKGNILAGSSGPAVDWLRSALDRIEGTSSFGDVYDEGLVSRVRQLQSDAGLVPDGIVGPRTLIVIQNRLAKPAAADTAQAPTG
jgi:hypothetical protein